ncbi:MAG: hypothetical protein IPM98_03750 [Lewinellaceae bacterium]|nr:hypothetical protein [Lewinellaceae bacterium]
MDALAAVLKALTVTPVRAAEAPDVEVLVFPNPVTDEAVFSINNYFREARVEFSAPAGGCVRHHIHHRNHRNTLRCAASDGSAGRIFWKMQTGEAVFSGRIVKQ